MGGRKRHGRAVRQRLAVVTVDFSQSTPYHLGRGQQPGPSYVQSHMHETRRKNSRIRPIFGLTFAADSANNPGMATEFPAVAPNGSKTRDDAPQSTNGGKADIRPTASPNAPAANVAAFDAPAQNAVNTVSAIPPVAMTCKSLTANTLHTNKYRPVPVASCEAGQGGVTDNVLMVRSDSITDKAGQRMKLEMRQEQQVPQGLKRGIYETEYGNAAYVSGPNAKTAYDLDMGERIPICMVTSKFIRKAE